jgi:3-dehydroquinate synthase
MVLAARYSARRGLLPRASAEHIARHLAGIGMMSEIASLGLNCDGKALVAHMLHDKKMDAGTLPFVLMKAVGEAFLARDVALDDVAEFLDEELRR